MEPARIISAARAAGLEAAQADLAGALAAARQWAREARGAVCVTGSLFLAGAVSSGGGEADPN
jgi:folylpolyglutamate synthase/dihydropteroate synthase